VAETFRLSSCRRAERRNAPVAKESKKAKPKSVAKAHPKASKSAKGKSTPVKKPTKAVKPHPKKSPAKESARKASVRPASQVVSAKAAKTTSAVKPTVTKPKDAPALATKGSKPGSGNGSSATVVKVSEPKPPTGKPASPKGKVAASTEVPIKPVVTANGSAKVAGSAKGSPAGTAPATAAPTKASAKAKSGRAPKVPVKPVISAKPGQILLTPLRPTGSAPVVAKPASPAPSAAPAAPEPAVKKPKPVIAPPPLPPAPVTTDSKAKKNQAGLSAREMEFFRDLLLTKRRELVGDMSSMEREALRGAGSNLSNLPVHMADMGTDNYEQEFTLGLVEKDRQLLREINLALAKVQNGTYGICEGTGKPISKARLEAQPWSKFSIEHVRALESRTSFRR
jgi:RNA polymerase-binding protein DksA